jgi:hypothetical protein
MNAISTNCKKRINPFVQRGGCQNDTAAPGSNSPATDPGYNQGNNSRLLKKQAVNIQLSGQQPQVVLLHDDIVEHLQSSTTTLKQLVTTGLDAGYSLPVFSAALNYYLGYTRGQSPANLIQAQRHHFGNHPFERMD